MLDELLGRDFGRHATDSAAYAADLQAARGEVDAKRLVRYVQVSTHTLGEHLADWGAARRAAELALEGRAPDAETGRAWGYLSIARLLAGDATGAATAELAWLGVADDVRSAAVELKFVLVSALVGSKRAGEAIPLYLAALELARRLGPAAPNLAIGQVSGALATDLLEAPSRTPDEVAVMAIAADAAHEAALVAGNWYADLSSTYLKALVANVMAEPDRAIDLVARARAIIAANQPCPVDEAFLHLTLAHAHALRGERDASARELAASDAIAAGWTEKPGLLRWHAEERARAFPNLPARTG
jgi:hypothetical protein